MSNKTSAQNIRLDTSEKRTSAPLLFLMSSLTIGGSERKTVRIANELHNRGCNVHVAYLNPPKTLIASLNSEIPVVCLERRGKLSLPAIRALERYVRKEGIVRIVCINLYPLIYALAAKRRLSAEMKPLVILAVNTTYHHGFKEKLSMALYSALIKRTQQIIFGCYAQLDLWCHRYALDKDKCAVIYNGVDHEKFSDIDVGANSERAVGGITVRDTDFLIGNVGQLRPVKNQVELIRALALLKGKLPNVRLVLVGDGPERSKLKTVVRETGLTEQVCFLGQQEDVRPVLQMLDLFVVPSISETFSNAALEAMSMGKAVILSDTGGAREMVQDGVTGYLYQQGNLESLAALTVGLAADQDGRRAIGQSARQAVLEKFSFSRMISEYQRLLDC